MSRVIFGLISLSVMTECTSGQRRCEASIGTSAGGACPPAWNQWRGRCYKATASLTLTWSEARLACLDLGGVMAVPHTQEETEFLMDLLSQMWIGCNDLQTEGFWECKEGALDVQYRNWAPREPNNVKGGEHCAAIKQRSSCSGQWTDVPCDEQYPAVCKRPGEHQLHF